MERNVTGLRVREARKRARPPLTQADLAARLQTMGLPVDQPIISKIENGRRRVKDYEVIALAQALRVPVAWLLGRD